jgi:membrane fusion protein (multidrug efflux system)
MRAFIPLLILCSLTACDQNQTAIEETPEVFVITAEQYPYLLSRGFNARIRSSSDVEIQAQVTGELLAIHFKEGDSVSQGDPLFDIDPAPYKAELSRVEAELSRAIAAQSIAEKKFERGKSLVDDGYIRRYQP